uniref:Reverse transcriptase zinc-binding domain-containing protein n=1 Tax=Davidia involucrata TaxID=16924 RepID=A0A5B7CEG1_DAVIN
MRIMINSSLSSTLDNTTGPDVGGTLEELAWLSCVFKDKSFKASIIKVFFSAAAYHIWRERNNRTFSGKCNPKEKIIQLILADLGDATISWRNVTRSFENWELCLSLGVTNRVFFSELLSVALFSDGLVANIVKVCFEVAVVVLFVLICLADGL